MKVTGDWLTASDSQAVCAALTGAGYRALFVGGCVRNSILGVAVGDVDIATDAPPEIVTVLAKKAGLKVIPTGFDHGTVTIIAGGVPHEVTTFRRDVETFGRHAVVAFSTRIEDDAMRRDLTMNALYATPEGEVVDPLGGLADCLARRVRFVGLAEERIREDYLRILRFFRFHAIYGDPDGGLDAEARARGHAIRRLFEESLYWAMLYGRFIDPAGWAVTGPAFFGSFPWPLNAVVPTLARKHMAKELWFQGTGRHPPDRIYASGTADLAALAVLLGDRPYCLGDAVTSVDATGYAFLANILVPPVETPLKRAAQGIANLVAYHDRMAAAWGTP